MLRRGVAALAVVALAGCATAEQAPSPSPATPSSSSTSDPSRPEPLDADLVADLQQVRRAHEGAEVAVALTPVGSDAGPDVVGKAPTLVAWSTIKVPLALAVTRSGDGASEDVEVALSASDNAAAERLWEDLGSGSEAADAVEEELRRGGDERTRVRAEITVPGASPFGQTRWRLADQTAYAAHLPCLPGSDAVLDPMGRVIEGQRWGLGGIGGSRIKGGWGSTPDGYVVRQVGLLPGAKGKTAAAVQVRAGTYEEGTAILDEVAEVLRDHRGDLPVGTC